jgi:hypothetical protein
VGLKALSVWAVILAINRFQTDRDQDEVLYAGMSQTRDKLVEVGDAEIIEKLEVLNSKLLIKNFRINRTPITV